MAKPSEDRPRPWWRVGLRCLRIVAIVYLLLCLLMMLFERYLVFPATRGGDWNPAWLKFEDAHFEAADGTKLHGWFLEQDSPREVVLYAHGNGGNLSHRAVPMNDLRRDLGVSVMIFDYRGYGKSEGSPDEAGILQDARAARAWFAQRTGRREQDIVLMGRSLGGGVMVDLAANDGARALILQSTFTSLPDVAAYHYPWLPVRLLMRTRLDSLAKIARYRGRVLQSHGTGDRIVPFESGRKLFEAVPDPGKRFVELAGVDHNDYDWPRLKSATREFLDQLDSR